MISDTLHDAIREIERYRRDCAASYSDSAVELDALVSLLDHVRSILDAPPNGSPLLSAELIAAIRVETHVDY